VRGENERELERSLRVQNPNQQQTPNEVDLKLATLGNRSYQVKQFELLTVEEEVVASESLLILPSY
jgi:hypothetical protein